MIMQDSSCMRLIEKAKVKQDSCITLVLPITNATNAEGLLKILNSYGRCVTFKDYLENPQQKKAIVVGKVVLEFKTYEDPCGNNRRKVYHLESIVPGDCSHFRFVASGKRMVDLISDSFGAGTGDHMALYQPGVMRSAADIPTFYFPPSTSTVWVCKAF